MSNEIEDYAAKLHANSELLEPREALEDKWVQKYGTHDKQIAKNRKARTEVVRDIIAGQNHHVKLIDCIEGIENVDVESRTAHIEISKWKTMADLHLRAMAKYVPDVKAVTIDTSPAADAAAEGISRLTDFLENAVRERKKIDDARAVQERSVVSTQIRAETERSGGS